MTSHQFQRWSTRTREVERFWTLPLSWERGLFLQPYGTSPLNREVERFQKQPVNCKAKFDLFLPRRTVVRRWPLTIAAIVFGGMYVNVGVQHFTDTAWFEPIVPAVLGDPTIWVLITGVMEIAIGVGLILPWTRRHAALGSFVFLIGIYWANLNMWINDLPIGGQSYANIWHVLRFVAQIGMIGLSLIIAGEPEKPFGLYGLTELE